jgi:hypothetical protein
MGTIGGGHHDVILSGRERRLIQLWIDSAAAYPGTYAALGSGMVGRQGWGKGPKQALARRCNGCHKDKRRLPQNPADRLGLGTTGTIRPRDHRLRLSPDIVFNLSRPEKSLFLLAPLAESAGGYSLCKPKGNGKPRPVFANAEEADYQALLKAVCASQAHLERIGRFDMPDFRPNRHYIREMKFYGILPSDLGPDAPIDVYATDRAYWESLWYKAKAHTSSKLTQAGGTE